MYIRLITYAYLLVLLAGMVIPLNTGTALNDNYTMSIRWDYLLHALVYLPLPLLLALSKRGGSRKTARPPGNAARPPGNAARPPETAARPPETAARPPGNAARPPGNAARPPETGPTVRPQNKKRFWIRIALYALLITAFMECLQLLIPYRAFNINDLIANGLGTGIGLVLVLAFRNRIGGVQHEITR